MTNPSSSDSPAPPRGGSGASPRRLFLLSAVALKEMRQSVRAKVAVIGLLLYLAALFLAALVCLNATPANDPDLPAGIPLAISTGIIFTFAALNAVPVLAAARAISEFDPTRRDISLTTTLTPSNIIDGKVVAAFCLVLLLAAATLPFLVLAFLLGGVPPGIAFLVLAFLVLASIPSTAYALVLACAPISRVFRFLLLAGWFLQGGIGIVSTLVSLSVGSFYAGPSIPDHIPGGAVAAVLAGSALSYLLLRAVAAFLITPPHLDRGRPLLRTVAALWAVSVLFACFPPESEKFHAWGVASLLCLLPAVPFIISGREGYSRRAVASAPASPFRRFLSFPFSTNSDSALLLVLLLGSVSAVVAALANKGGSENFLCPVVFCLYVFNYFATARLVWLGAFRRSRVSPKVAPAVTFGFIAFATIVAASAAGVNNDLDFSGVPFIPLAALSDDNISLHIFCAGIWFLFLLAPFLLIQIRTFHAYRAPEHTS